LLLEQNSRVGGLCRSIQTGGFTFDYAGHIMFSNEPYVHKLYKMLLGDNVHWQEREAWIYSKGVHTRYPFQGALYGLPPEVVKECLVGAIEARFGSLKGPNGHSSQPQSESGLLESRRLGAGTNGNGKHSGQVREKQLVDCCGDGIVPEQLRDASAAACSSGLEKARSFEDFIYQVWGAGIARHFAIPYNRKLWAVPLDQMETSWLGGRVPIPDLEEMIDGALRPVPKPMGPNARFGYPLKGGFQALMDGFLPLLQGQLMLNARVVSIRPDDRQITLSDGRTVAYDCLISTMPLPGLIGLIHGPVPSQVRSAAAGLRHVSVRCVHLGVGRENLTEKHWVYYPESTVFHRIFFQGNASPHCNPPGGFGLTCEITYSKHKPLPSDGDDLIRRCVEDCVAVGVIKKDDPIWTACQIDLPYAYVVYDHQRSSNVAVVRNWLAENRIILAGRYAEWEYYNSDHAFISGKKAAERALEFMAQEDPLVAAGPITALNGFASR
jgi:UDP-galactopyranose mutase